MAETPMNIQIIPLSEGVFTIGHDKIFHPFNEAEHELNDRPIGSLLVEIQPFLVRLGEKNILFDTGLGFKTENGVLQIHENLSRHGLDAHDIDSVILSHLHKDHAGGVSFLDGNGVRSLSFPRATYYVSQQEFAYALQQGAPSYLVDDFQMLSNSTQTVWLDTVGNIEQCIHYIQDGGHCPYHTSFLIDTPIQKIFFGGDVAPQLKQLKIKYVAKYDFDGKRSMEQRAYYAEQGRKDRWHFLFYHDVKMPVAQLPE